MEVETERAGLNTTLELSENTVEQLKTEIQYLSKEKTEVTDQLNAVSYSTHIYVHVPPVKYAGYLT